MEHLVLDRARRTARLAREGMAVDLGGIAKGWILQDALRVLAERGLPRALLEAGGDIVVGDAPPGAPGWVIATPGAAPTFAARAARLRRAALGAHRARALAARFPGTVFSVRRQP